MERGVLWFTMIRISIGTEGVLGIKNLKTDILPTTAYIMFGNKCLNNCKFCSQAKDSNSKEGMLSRVVWNKAREDLWYLVEKRFNEGKIQRACIQVVSQPGILNMLVQEIEKAKRITQIPLCISGGITCMQDVVKLMELGVERVTIALDAVSPEIYKRVKSGDFETRLELLKECAVMFPGKIGTHLIVGLGESEEQMVEMLQMMHDENIVVALFAFTPVKGTKMESLEQPPIESYRRIQIAHYLIKKKICRKEDITFENGKITGLPLSFKEIRKILANGEAFLTSGCAGCNRPYYNERPGGILYNYPRKMSHEEIEKAIKETELW